AGVGLVAGILGLLLGWMIFSKDRETQQARDRFEVPLLYPLPRRAYYLDDVADGVTYVTMGPPARFANWTNTYLFDGIVNAAGGLTMLLGRFVYNGLDQRGVDGIVHGLTAATDGAGTVMRKWQSGRVHQYAAASAGGAIVLAAVFMLGLWGSMEERPSHGMVR